jgi:hypothetical protein
LNKYSSLQRLGQGTNIVPDKLNHWPVFYAFG